MKKLLTILFFAVLITGCRKEIQTGVTEIGYTKNDGKGVSSLIEGPYRPYPGHLSLWIVDESQPDNNYCYCAPGSRPPNPNDGIRHYPSFYTVDSTDKAVRIGVEYGCCDKPIPGVIEKWVEYHLPYKIVSKTYR